MSLASDFEINGTMRNWFLHVSPDDQHDSIHKYCDQVVQQLRMNFGQSHVNITPVCDEVQVAMRFPGSQGWSVEKASTIEAAINEILRRRA